MTEHGLRRRVEELERQLVEAQDIVAALTMGAIDAVVTPGLVTPILIQDAQQKLRRSEGLFRAVIEKSAEAISLTSADGTTRYLTPSAWQLLGWTPEELGPTTLLDQVVPEDRARIARDLKRFERTGERDTSLEFRVRHRDGSVRWIESTGTNLLDDPDVGAIVGSYRDVTARKNAEEALRRSRDQLEEAQAVAHVGSWASGLGPDAEIHWTRECCRIFGLPEGTVITVGQLGAHIHPDDRDRVRRASDEARTLGASFDIEHRVQRPDGRPCWVRARAFVSRPPSGEELQLAGTVQDITDRQTALAVLKASEERYRRIVEGTSEGVWTYDARSVTTFMNACMAEMLGYTPEEVVGESVYTFLLEADHAVGRARIESRHRGAAGRSEVRLRHRDGTERWTSINANPMFDAEGRFDAGLLLVTDISARRRADEARAHLAAIVESSEDAIIGVSPNGAITSWNGGAEKLYQYSFTEAVGSSVFALIPPELLDEERRNLERVARGESVASYEVVRRRKDGSTVDVAVTISPVRDAQGAVIGVSKISRDLTARKVAEAALRRTEDQFLQAQKMEAVGRLAGGVAHDFNNMLSVILSYSDLLLQDLKRGDPMSDDVAEIQKAARRSTELTQQLLAFSRQQILQPRVIDLNGSIAGMERMLRRLLGEDIELTVVADAGVGRIFTDPGQVEQVVMNLAVNARDAMPQGGKLTIETDNVDLDATYVSAHVGVAPGAYVMLALTDTGTGMDAATRARIFEPFFTTKDKGKGTGLGLATVFGIVKQSGGHVGVYSEPGHGTTFKIYFPRTDQATERALAALPSVEPRGAETILLVEDEEQVRTVVCAILRRHGYTVLDTSNGGEALLASREFPANIHLLLTDVVMPRMSGRRVAEELAPQRPEMKVLFASGYTDDAIVQHGVLNAGVEFLQKPFTPAALLRKVRAVLGSPGLAAK